MILGTSDVCREMSGYGHRDYAWALSDLGRPRHLTESDGWVIERDIPGTQYRDAMGPYPLFSCADWQALPTDIIKLKESGLVTLTLVTEPFPPEAVTGKFAGFDLARPFKTHYVTDLELVPERSVSKHHLSYARKASREIDVEIVVNPVAHLREWEYLYGHLIARHGIKGLRGFSTAYFEKLLNMPGVIMFRALRQNRLVGGRIMLIQGDVAYCHLVALSPEGYRHRAAYALYWRTIEHLRNRVRYVNLGGGTQPIDAPMDGLAKFKSGWGTLKRTSFLLGAVLNPAVHSQLSYKHCTDYFPPYRSGEYAGDRQ
jgi:hypothetical protein